MGISQNMQPSKKSGTASGINTPHDHIPTRLHELSNHQVQRPHTLNEEQERVVSDGAAQKPDTSMLNDRAAELRAKLLAKRGSTPGTPSQTSKSSDAAKLRNNEATSSQRQMGGRNLTESIAEKTAGGSKNQTVVGTKAIEKSTSKTQVPTFEKKNSSTDIDGLLAEGRAAAAAGKAKTGDIIGLGGIAAKGSKENGTSPLTNVNLSEKAQQDLKTGGHRRSLNKSTSSSEASELGEIRSNSGKDLTAHNSSGPVNSKAGKEKSTLVDEKPKHGAHISNGVKKQPTKKLDGPGQVKEAINSVQPRPTSSSKPSASSPTGSQFRDPAQGSRSDHRRDRYDRPPLNQEVRKDHEQDRRRDPDYKERNTDSRRSSGSRAYGYESERGRADHHLEVDTRRPQTVHYDVEESARAAAEYKKELEERRRQTSRAISDKAGPAKDQSKKEADSAGPRTPKARTTESQQHATNHDSNNRNSNSKPGEIGTIFSSRESHDDHITEDVRDWLEMTGFSDPNYQKTALARFRKIKALDLQKAELEREAQLEIEGRAQIARAQSALPRESVEANVAHTSISPKIIRTSVLSMPPPPIPTKNVVDDIGIKIKDSANREAVLNRPTEDDMRTSKRGYDLNKTRTSMKRSHGDDELDSRSGRVAEKLSRVESSGHANDYKTNSSPTASRGHWSLDNRTNRLETHERLRSRSPESRNRSASPIRGRTSTYDQYVPRQRSRSPARRNGYSPDRQSGFNRSALHEKPKHDSPWCWNCQQTGHHPRDCAAPRKRRETEITDESYENSRSSPLKNKKSEIKTENEQSQYVGDYQASTMRPSVGTYQNHHSINYRGRGRGGRVGFQYANTRGGYKSYRPEGTQDIQVSGGSASLNLRAGGQS